MAYNSVFFFYLLFSITSLVTVPHAFAQREAVPPDVLELRPEGYVYADYPGVFDNVASVGIDRRRGLTVEAWIYLTDKPKDDFTSLYLRVRDSGQSLPSRAVIMFSCVGKTLTVA